MQITLSKNKSANDRVEGECLLGSKTDFDFKRSQQIKKLPIDSASYNWCWFHEKIVCFFSVDFVYLLFSSEFFCRIAASVCLTAVQIFSRCLDFYLIFCSIKITIAFFVARSANNVVKLFNIVNFKILFAVFSSSLLYLCYHNHFFRPFEKWRGTMYSGVF